MEVFLKGHRPAIVGS